LSRVPASEQAHHPAWPEPGFGLFGPEPGGFTIGKRGPKPKPTSLKLVEGARPSRVNRREPKPEAPEALEPPEWLGTVACAYWADLAPRMTRAGVLSSVDLHGLAVLCQALEVHQRAAEILAEEELVIQGKEGVVLNKVVQALRDSAATIRAWSAEFGLTPSSRSTISLPETAPSTEATRLLS